MKMQFLKMVVACVNQCLGISRSIKIKNTVHNTIEIKVLSEEESAIGR